ncbi:unnamed protein product [Sphagnum compactum]
MDVNGVSQCGVSSNGSSVSSRGEDGEIADGEMHGVLLYYKFVVIPDVPAVVAWFSSLCSSLALLGRIRIAPDGVNVTVGGTMESLFKHMDAVDANPLFANIDFKLSSCKPCADQKVAVECGFTTLSVRAVKELITLGLHPSIEQPSVSNAGQHLTAKEFHTILERAALSAEYEGNSGEKEYVLLDARNIYETRIGKFRLPPGVAFHDPMLRQYSDLPSWLDAHADQLRNKQVLMYCTGGVRCELASAYLRSKGREFEDVYQLSGGIHRYLEAFADGGFFKGKNFVFDHRMAVASSNPEVLGCCLLCKVPFDSYSSRTRCSLCRLLVLVCTDCQACSTTAAGPVTYVCELCEMNGKSSIQKSPVELCKRNIPSPTVVMTKAPIVGMPSPLKEHAQAQKLRVLCLHGFRQNASSFRGRLSALRKKLKHIADMVFIDAPHELPFLYQKHQSLSASQEIVLSSGTADDAGGGGMVEDSEGSLQHATTRKYGWLISSSIEGDLQELVDVCSPAITPSSDSNEDLLVTQQGRSNGNIWMPVLSAFNPLQYESQSQGWSRSWWRIQEAFSNLGPFDGVLGFSQGAAIAAVLCQLRSSSNMDFRFVILCSGFPSPVLQHQQLIETGSVGGIACPSLHIFGRQDRQIGVCKSKQLVELFDANMRMIVEHDSGHIIPTKPQYVQQYVQFLSPFL